MRPKFLQKICWSNLTLSVAEGSFPTVTELAAQIFAENLLVEFNPECSRRVFSDRDGTGRPNFYRKFAGRI